MYNNISIIEEKLREDLDFKFGSEFKEMVFALIGSLAKIDTFVDNNLILNAQNLLDLDMAMARQFVKLAEDLSLVSAFAPVLLLEKIPTLIFYDITSEIILFLNNIKDYGARAISLFLGSDQLKTDDLLDILEQTSTQFYKSLLEAVNLRHRDFGVCSAMIMRHASYIESTVALTDIHSYLDICKILYEKHGTKIAEQYIKYSHQFIISKGLKEQVNIVNGFVNKSLEYAEFALSQAKIIMSTEFGLKTKLVNPNQDDFSLKNLKVELLKTEDYLTILENDDLFLDKNFASLILSWPTLSGQIKQNILHQLQIENYNDFIINRSQIKNEISMVNKVTNDSWLKPWMFCEEVIDITYIRKRMSKLIQKSENFSIAIKSIVNQNKELFSRDNQDYHPQRVLSMVKIFLNHCIDKATYEELEAFSRFIDGDMENLKNLLSANSLVITTWNRDPWKDYGRSDELFSCTSLGDYNAGNAPGFLADINLNNLDVWSGQKRVGRIHLCLIKDKFNEALLLLDCVDGTDRMLASKKKYDFILSSIIHYAKSLNINKIKINYDIDYNTTPKKFINFVKESIQAEEIIDFFSRFLTVGSSKYLIPFPCQTFLESFIKKNGGFIRGNIILLENHGN